jgi:uncharacterized repeat protein (TIGR01451 family)
MRRVSLNGIVLIALVAGIIGPIAPVANAAPIVAVDTGGRDDQPGQKDLNALSVDYGLPGATTINVKWNWDDTATSGNNTRDGGALFDTDGDGFANYSLYVTVATDGTWVTRLFSCAADNRSDRCSGPALVGTFSSTASVSTVPNSDPFGVPSSPFFNALHVTGNTCDAKPACYTADTIADTNIVLADFGSTSAKLINVCSYPSGEPNSDPSDCVFAPNSGFLTIVKVAPQGSTQAFSFTASSGSATSPPVSTWTINGGGTVALQVPFAATTTLDLNEAVPAGWQLDSASCVIQSSPTAATGTPDAPPAQLGGANVSKGVQNFEIKSGLETICTFTDSLTQGTLKLVKVVDNLGESGPGYKGVSDFPLTIDGTSTTSGTPVTVTAGNHTIAETSQTGYSVGTWTCDDGTSGTAGSTSATVNVSGGENVTCTMTNTLIAAPSLNIVKSAQESSVNAAGDVIHYTITVTNNGNQTLTGVSVSDSRITNLDCDDQTAGNQTTGFTLAPGGILTCTGTYTVTQADIDNNGGGDGDIDNTATADSDQTGPDTDDETVPLTQTPSLTLTKSASPTTYSAAGQVITYTYGLTNSGNVTLTGPFVITDDKIGTVTCGTASSTLAPGASFAGTCTGTYTIQAADVLPTNNGSVTNHATATAKDPAGNTVTSNQAQATVNQIATTGKIAPTATTCQDFKNGTAGDLTEILYTVKGQKINSVAPGVLFYYSLVTLNASGSISVTQTANPSFTLFGIQQNQAVLYNSNCVKIANNATGTFLGLSAGTYIVGIKYDPGTVVGQTKPGGNGEVVYTFTTNINGIPVASSPDSVTLKPKPNGKP